MRPLITLTTDFGYKDPFVGIMKGVILSINPATHIVDITHGIRPQGIKEAVFVIEEAHRFFPEGTVHVAVVDPEVGSQRRPIVIKAKGQFFVGPDNGIFTSIVKSRDFKAYHLTNEKYFLPAVGSTFHGRDVFAPSAAWLTKGISPSKMGKTIIDPVMISLPEATAKGNKVIGEVIYIDGFGNAITNIRGSLIKGLGPGVKITVGRRNALPVRFYAEAKEGKLSALINSSGLLEIFLFKDNASKTFNIHEGQKVQAKVTDK